MDIHIERLEDGRIQILAWRGQREGQPNIDALGREAEVVSTLSGATAAEERQISGALKRWLRDEAHRAEAGAALGRKGGLASGESKVRGDSEHYRRLAAKSAEARRRCFCVERWCHVPHDECECGCPKSVREEHAE